jgi:hypothetical protein
MITLDYDSFLVPARVLRLMDFDFPLIRECRLTPTIKGQSP